ncbi:MAG TPA: hypothetical protein VER11_14940 [Polyangiaceae bacterium]|nr:hypothetical protein [Polyangiaceae bacterium]
MHSLTSLGLHSVFWQAVERWLSLTLSAALIAILLEWLGKARAEPLPEGHRTMIYPRAYGYFGLTFAAACCAMACFVWVSAPEARAIAVIFVAVSLAGFWAYVDVRVTRIELSAEGVRERTILRKPTFTRWSDVTRIERRQHCLALERHAVGNTLRISFSLCGLQDFARLSLSYVPEAHVAPEARDVLRRMAAGELPAP